MYGIEHHMHPRTTFLILLSLWLAVSEVSSADQSNATIPIVKTWAELRNAPVVARGGFGQARVGLQSVTAPVHSGILVYCLVELSPENTQVTEFNASDNIGPLRCEINQISRERNLVHQSTRLITPRRNNVQQILYLKTVAFDHHGRRSIRILD